MQQGMRQGQANRARQLQGRSAWHAPCPGSSTDHSKEPNHIARPAAKHRTVQRSLMTSAPCTASQRLGTQDGVGHGQATHQVDAADVLPKRCSVARAGATCGACAKVDRSPSVSYAQAALQMQPLSDTMHRRGTQQPGSRRL